MTRRAEDGQIEAYTTRVSAPPGALLELKVSTSERAFRMSAYRIGDYDGGTGHLVHRSELVRGERQADPVFQPLETRTVVAPWHVSLTADTTGWEPGFYVLRLRTTSGWEHQVPYIVSSPSAAGNDRRGGPGDDLAGLQPLGRLQPLRRPERRPAQLGGQLRPALPRRRWHERLPHRGRPDRDPGRDEPASRCPTSRTSTCTATTTCWPEPSATSRPATTSTGRPACGTTVETARDAGTNLAFLGANTAYWRVRLDDRPTGPTQADDGLPARRRAWTRSATRGRPRRRPGSGTRRRPSPRTR